jgi:UDP-N-acetylglucosamine/UDP-N-acetylgalactosamine diphosphorylase
MNEKDFLRLLEEHDQRQMLAHYAGMDRKKQLELINNLTGLDFDLVFKLYNDCLSRRDAGNLIAEVKPARIIPMPETPEERAYCEKAKSVGESLISNNRVATLIVAGGQGVRLGHDRPKGTFSISPVMHKTLFQLFAEQMKAISTRYKCSLPLLIMTSYENHGDTIAFFDSNRYFGLSKDDVFFFQQAMLPTVTPDGNLFLKDDTHLFQNPDGHGGSLRALYTSGLLGDLMERGFTELFYCQVDNPLVRIADPVFLGYHALVESECSTKVVRRKNIDEKVGVYVTMNGTDAILEYSDFDGKHMRALDENGALLYWAGNTAIHVLSLPFIERLNSHGFALPYHCASKQQDIINADGTKYSLNLWKFETFVFDAMPLAARTCCMEVDRAEEFSPVKNSTGPDSPETARQAMNRQHKRWLEAAGIKVSPGACIEISPLFALDEDELVSKLKGKVLSIDEDTYFG